jgi:hypothetical protein
MAAINSSDSIAIKVSTVNITALIISKQEKEKKKASLCYSYCYSSKLFFNTFSSSQRVYSVKL